MAPPVHPYNSQSERAFWRAAVSGRHYASVSDIWQPLPLHRTDRIATAGSCFAQHIGSNLAARGAAFMDMEPPPRVFESETKARDWGYGVFSCRYGNIYTSRQLLQLFDEAQGARTPVERVWKRDDRFYDALRVGVDPVGHESAEIVLALRSRHLAAVRRMFSELDVFIFTLGQTEGWESTEDGTMFPVAPGVIADSYDPSRHLFRNLRTAEIRADMMTFWERLRSVNPRARMLLSVSPVPLAATATQQHVLAASTYAKSVLRAVAGELAEDVADIHYFPSYELIAAHPSRGAFYEPDLRKISAFGVNYVMKHFFSGPLALEFDVAATPAVAEEVELICEEGKLDSF